MVIYHGVDLFACVMASCAGLVGSMIYWLVFRPLSDWLAGYKYVGIYQSGKLACCRCESFYLIGCLNLNLNFILRMMVLGRGLIFQPVLLACICLDYHLIGWLAGCRCDILYFT